MAACLAKRHPVNPLTFALFFLLSPFLSLSLSLPLSTSLSTSLAFYVHGIATRARRAVLYRDLQRNHVEVYSKPRRTGRDSTEGIYSCAYMYSLFYPAEFTRQRRRRRYSACVLWRDERQIIKYVASEATELIRLIGDAHLIPRDAGESEKMISRVPDNGASSLTRLHYGERSSHASA
jgi:hypothetical protein